MRRLTAVAAVATALFVACSPDTTDFQSEAEKYIETREFSERAGLLRLSEAECEEPESTEVDVTYLCTATAEDGSRWQFVVEITGETHLQVQIPGTNLSVTTAPGEGSTATPTTTAAASTTTTPTAPTTTATAT